jgi:hypothetical protein
MESDMEISLEPEESKQRSPSTWWSSAPALLGGSVLGTLAKFADHSTIPGAGDLGTYMGLWVLLVTIIAVRSPSISNAILRTLAFLLGMLVSYYFISGMFFGHYPRSYILSWAIIALVLAPPFALIVWHSRGAGWKAAVCAAIPVALIGAEALSLRWRLTSHPVQFYFDLSAALLLMWILASSGAQRLRTLFLGAIFTLGAGVLLKYVWEFVGY